MLTTFRPTLRVGSSLLLALVGTAFSTPGTYCHAQSRRVWTTQQAGVAHDLRGVAYGRGLFVAVGDNGTLLTSATGTDWTPQPSGTTRALYSVTYGADRFVAVGEGTILTSADGVRWVGQEPAPVYAHLRNVSYAGGRYVAAAGFAGLLTSPDGVNWTGEAPASFQYLTGVASDGASVVAVGGEGALQTASAGAVRWMPKGPGTSAGEIAQQPADLRDVRFGGGRFVAVGARGVFTSPDGATWTKAPGNEPVYLYGVGYGGAEFVAVGYDGVIQTSPDGRVWTAQASHTKQLLYAVSCTDAQVVAVGAGGTIISAAGPGASPAASSEPLPKAPVRQVVRAGRAPQPAQPAPFASLLPPDGAAPVERLPLAVAYPNPSESGLFRVVLPGGARHLSVTTGQGHPLLNVPSPATTADLDLSQFGGGVYYLRVETPTGGQVLKLVKP